MKKLVGLTRLRKAYSFQSFNLSTFCHSYGLTKTPTEKLTGVTVTGTFYQTSQLCAEPALAAGFFYGG